MNLELESINCNLCGKSDTALWARVSYADYLSRRPELKRDDDPILRNNELANYKFSIVKCNNCGLVYVSPRLTESGLEKLYKGDYFSSYADMQSEAYRRRQETFKCEIRELEKLVSKSKTLDAGNVGRKILDVGCGGGASSCPVWTNPGTNGELRSTLLPSHLGGLSSGLT